MKAEILEKIDQLKKRDREQAVSIGKFGANLLNLTLKKNRAVRGMETNIKSMSDQIEVVKRELNHLKGEGSLIKNVLRETADELSKISQIELVCNQDEILRRCQALIEARPGSLNVYDLSANVNYLYLFMFSIISIGLCFFFYFNK